MAQMKKQIKTPEKIQVSNEEIANLLGAQFKTLVIRMLTELTEWHHKIKENIQGTNSDEKEMGTRINDLEQKEEISIRPEQNEETRIQNNEERLRNLWNNFTCSNIWIIGVSEEKRKRKKL